MDGCSYLKSVAAVFFAAICAYLGAWLFPSISQMPDATPALSAAETYIALEGIALRNERPVSAPGKARFLPREGQRLAAGSLLWSGGQGESLQCGKSAIFMVGCDGFEYLAPPSADSFGAKTLSGLLNAQPEDSPGQARLVEGFYWYYAAFAPKSAPEIAPGRHYLKFEGFDKYCRALLIKCEETDEGRALLFRLSLGDTEYLDLRKCRAELLVSDFA